MFTVLGKAIVVMALIRILSGCMEIFAAYLMIRFNEIDKALIINSSIALIDPLILLLTTAIGVAAIADRLSIGKFVFIIIGVAFILYGIKK
ncbi:YqhV family protein [Lentibacillus sp. L22]|nr:YqhV family protein [Lentibacillus daqui]